MGVSPLQSFRIMSMITSCIKSSKARIWSYTDRTHSTALAVAQLARKMNALRLQVVSDSAARKVCMSSGASGISCSKER